MADGEEGRTSQLVKLLTPGNEGVPLAAKDDDGWQPIVFLSSGSVQDSLYLYMEGPSLFGGPYEYEGFCMWRAYPSPPLSATRMRISASCLYIARCYFGNHLVLQSSDLEGSYNTDPGHGYSGSWFVF